MLVVLVHEDRRLVGGEERGRPVQVLVEVVLPLAGCLAGEKKTHRAVFSRGQTQTHTERNINFITVAFTITVNKLFSLQKAAKFP